MGRPTLLTNSGNFGQEKNGLPMVFIICKGFKDLGHFLAVIFMTSTWMSD